MSLPFRVPFLTNGNDSPSPPTFLLIIVSFFSPFRCRDFATGEDPPKLGVTPLHRGQGRHRHGDSMPSKKLLSLIMDEFYRRKTINLVFGTLRLLRNRSADLPLPSSNDFQEAIAIWTGPLSRVPLFYYHTPIRGCDRQVWMRPSVVFLPALLECYFQFFYSIVTSPPPPPDSVGIIGPVCSIRSILVYRDQSYPLLFPIPTGYPNLSTML